MPIVSVIIVTYNSKDDITDCLADFIKADDERCEVVLLDNNSPDKTGDFLMANFSKLPFFKVIINNENVGFAKGVNQAAKYCVGQYLLILNPDTLMTVESVFKLVEKMENNGNVAIVGPKIVDENGVIAESFGRYFTLWSELNGRIFGSLYLEKIPFFKKIRSKSLEHAEGIVGWIGGACMLISREVFLRLNGIDDYFFYSAGDMVDLCQRAAESGYHSLYVPSVSIMHRGGKSTTANKDGALKNSYEGGLYFIKKHKGIFFALMLRLIYLITSILKILIAGILVLAGKDEYKNIVSSHLKNSIRLLLFKI